MGYVASMIPQKHFFPLPAEVWAGASPLLFVHGMETTYEEVRHYQCLYSYITNFGVSMAVKSVGLILGAMVEVEGIVKIVGCSSCEYGTFIINLVGL